MTDPSHILFPADAPALEPARAPAPSWHTLTPVPLKPRQQEPMALATPDAAAALFHTEKPADHTRPVVDVLEGFAHSAMTDGDPARAEDWRNAATGLANDFRSAGTPEGDIAEIMQLTREAMSEVLPGMSVSAERLEATHIAAMDALTEQGVTDSDLNLARRLIDEMEAKTPGLKSYLDGTGMGNSPRVIAKAVAEAKRRYGG